MKLSISTKKEDIRDGGGSLDFIAEEGVFPVTMNFASISETKNGAKAVNFNFMYKDKAQTIYGPNIINIDKQQNAIGMALINKLGVIAGLGNGDDLTIETETHAVGKDNTDTEFEVITDFSNLDVWLHVVREYSRYDGRITRRMSIRNVFRDDKASAAEIDSNTDTGKQFEITLEKYCKPVYRDGVTPEEAEAFEANERAARSGNKTAAAPTSSVVNKKRSAFGAR